METLKFMTLEGGSDTLSSHDVSTLADDLSGTLITPEASSYDSLRQPWNAKVDHHPALIARCLGVDDVCRAVDFAREHRMRLSVRGGGHHIAGNAIAEGGLVIDLSALRDVQVDTDARTARVAPGALLGDVDRATQAAGLATPLGINSTTGVAGLCLGGGFGWLTRRHGLTADNLLSAEIVTADGQRLRTSETEHPDLFWAIRGGGGNFGIATSFELELHPIGPEVYAGLIVYPFHQAEQVLQAWRDFTAQASEELSVWVVLRRAPPLPFLPEQVHGERVVVLALLHCGADLEAAARECDPVRRFGDPIGEMLAAQPYVDFQAAFDPLLAPGARNYWKSHNFARLDNDALDEALAATEELPGPECELFLAQLGGAMSRVAPTATAYAGRDARFVMNVHARWQDAADDNRCRDWARRVFQAMTPFATGGGYVNFLTEDELDRVGAAYGVNFPRLQAVKRHYDPDNLFRLNLNIPPASAEDAA